MVSLVGKREPTRSAESSHRTGVCQYRRPRLSAAALTDRNHPAVGQHEPVAAPCRHVVEIHQETLVTANKAIREHHSRLSQLEVGRHIPITGVYAQQLTMAFDPHHIARLHNARMALGDDNHRALRTLGTATQRLGQHPIHRLPSDRFHQKTNRLRHGPDGATIRVFGDADDLRHPVPRKQSPRSGVVGCAGIADHTAIYDHDIERTRFHMTEPLEFPNGSKASDVAFPRSTYPSPVIFRPNHFRFRTRVPDTTTQPSQSHCYSS